MLCRKGELSRQVNWHCNASCVRCSTVTRLTNCCALCVVPSAPGDARLAYRVLDMLLASLSQASAGMVALSSLRRISKVSSSTTLSWSLCWRRLSKTLCWRCAAGHDAKESARHALRMEWHEGISTKLQNLHALQPTSLVSFLRSCPAYTAAGADAKNATGMTLLMVNDASHWPDRQDIILWFSTCL